MCGQEKGVVFGVVFRQLRLCMEAAAGYNHKTATALAGASHARAMRKKLRCMHCGEVFTMNKNNGPSCKARYNEKDGWVLSVHEVR